MRNAESRNPTGDHPRTRRARIAPGEAVSTSVQPGVVPACLREDLPQRRLHDARRQRGDRGRHEPGEDPGDHQCAAIRALSMDPGPTCLHRQERVTGKRRPLGLPTWSDKLLQEVIRSLLEAYYEPQFSDRSHGFRPGRGCHTALAEVSESW